MRRRARAGGLFMSAVLVGAVAACSQGVAVAVPTGLSDQARAACSAVVWPPKVAGLAQVATKPSSALTAAWGDPPLVARCGLPSPGPTTDDCVAVNGIDWVIHPLTDGTRLTTFGRDPAIELLIPNAHGPAPLLLPAFDQAARKLPPNGHACN